MNKTNQTRLVIALVIVIGLFLLSGVGAITGAMMNGGFMGTGWMSASGALSRISWMWIPTVLTFGLGVLFGWALFAKHGASVNNKPPTAHAEALMTWADDGGQGG